MILLNGSPINVTIFPDKTSQVWKNDESLYKQFNNIEWQFESEGELFQLIQLCSLIRQRSTSAIINLYCPYLPWARQHKVMSNETTFALEIFCDLIEFYINELKGFDIHNTEFFYKNGRPRWNFKLVNIEPQKEILDIIASEQIDLIIFPDESAKKRYEHLVGVDSIFIEKKREQSTGVITGMIMPDISHSKKILVVDDLCDGGFTFTSCASLIKQYNPSSLILYVSHGIFSKGTEILYQAGYNKIYTRNGLV